MHFSPDDFEAVPCDFCDCDAAIKRFTKRGFNIVQCRKCGMVYTNPRLTDAIIRALYDSDYFQGQGFDTTVDYVREVEDYNHTGSTYTLHDWDLDWIKTLLPKASVVTKPRLLEIGCGTGVFLAKAKEHGFDCEGLELSSYAANFVRNRGIPVQMLSIEDAHIEEGVWDVIVMREVIEHLPHPRASLATVRKWLAPGGVLFMATGNYDCPERKLRGAKWSYFMPEGHLYYFSNRTMRRYLRAAGFSSVHVTNQGDMLMEKLRSWNILERGNVAPRSVLKKMIFHVVRTMNHFISSGMRIYAIK
jgi:2-polyprenyl-3-methyl-5-hydroxy-6-metoxy-1,4-benzoquinol methylase